MSNEEGSTGNAIKNRVNAIDVSISSNADSVVARYQSGPAPAQRKQEGSAASEK